VRDAKNEQVVFEKNSMTFTSVSEEENKEKHYRNDIELFGAIDPDVFDLLSRPDHLLFSNRAT
jgi:hypothetical protein